MHLGCTLQSSNSMGLDVCLKSCQFYGKVNSILQEFYSSEPKILLKCINSYATSFPGSQLWDLFSSDCDRLYKSWNVTIWQVFNLDRRTHRSLIEPISNMNHLKTILISRFVNFAKKLLISKKFTVRFLANLRSKDQRSLFGRNIFNILKLSHVEGFDELAPSSAKLHIRYWPGQEEERWRQYIAQGLLEIRGGAWEVHGFSNTEIQEMLTFVCTEWQQSFYYLSLNIFCIINILIIESCALQNHK